jgi:hypothetical protein
MKVKLGIASSLTIEQKKANGNPLAFFFEAVPLGALHL